MEQLKAYFSKEKSNIIMVLVKTVSQYYSNHAIAHSMSFITQSQTRDQVA